MINFTKDSFFIAELKEVWLHISVSLRFCVESYLFIYFAFFGGLAWWQNTDLKSLQALKCF